MVLTLFLGALAPVVTATPAVAAPAGKIMIVGDSISQGHEGDYTRPGTRGPRQRL